MDRFIPHPLIPGGQLQTIAGIFSRIHRRHLTTRYEFVDLPDGDKLLIAVDHPVSDGGERPVIILMHGLGGSYASSYMLRHSYHLTMAGCPVVRVNHRGCGPAHLDRAQHIYHSGRTGDLHAVLQYAVDRWPERRLAVIGYSFSGNLLLRYLGGGTHGTPHVRAGEGPPPRLSKALAICPPIDLEACSQALVSPRNWHIHRYLVHHITRQAAAREVRTSGAARVQLPRYLDLRTFDQIYTAPRAGFASREDYYAQCSAKDVLSLIKIPTTIVVADDDPIVPVEIFANATLSSDVSLRIIEGGGHMGFISRDVTPLDDRRWLDAQVVAWAMGS